VLAIILLLLLTWLCVAVCAWAAVYAAGTWRAPGRRRMRPVSYRPQGPRGGGVS
jgi:hypothetical protein